MTAYLIANVEVRDEARFAEYRAAVEPMIEAYGGRCLVRGTAVAMPEGALAVDRLVLLEFDDMDRLRAFYEGAEYAALMPLRAASAHTDVALFEGYPPGRNTP